MKIYVQRHLAKACHTSMNTHSTHTKGKQQTIQEPLGQSHDRPRGHTERPGMDTRTYHSPHWAGPTRDLPSLCFSVFC